MLGPQEDVASRASELIFYFCLVINYVDMLASVPVMASYFKPYVHKLWP